MKKRGGAGNTGTLPSTTGKRMFAVINKDSGGMYDDEKDVIIADTWYLAVIQARSSHPGHVDVVFLCDL